MAKLFHDIARSSRDRKPASTTPTADLAAAILTSARQLQTGRICGFGNLRQLFRSIPSDTITIGQFHDAVRGLAKSGKIRLHPFTQPLYQLADVAGEYAMIYGNEVMAFVEAL
jgi:hypothetical protein